MIAVDSSFIILRSNEDNELKILPLKEINQIILIEKNQSHFINNEKKELNPKYDHQIIASISSESIGDQFLNISYFATNIFWLARYSFVVFFIFLFIYLF